MDILEEIVAHKRLEIEKSKNELPLDKLKSLVRAGLKPAPTKASFYQSIKTKIDKKQIALIAEVKKASP